LNRGSAGRNPSDGAARLIGALGGVCRLGAILVKERRIPGLSTPV
jgi:hypothetical protein